MIDQAHEFVLAHLLAALGKVGIKYLSSEGLSDLVVADENDGHQSDASKDLAKFKFSGNSLRITRDALLYHGTILYDFPIDRISELLNQPPREPTYRHQRGHQQFIKNIDASRDQVVAALGETWGATEPMTTLSIDAVNALVREKYAKREWNFRH